MSSSVVSMLKVIETSDDSPSSFQDVILSKVNEVLSIFKPVSEDDSVKMKR